MFSGSLQSSRSRSSSGTFTNVVQTPAPSDAAQTTPARLPTTAELVELCLDSLAREDRARTGVSQRNGETVTGEINFEVDVRFLHDSANKLSLDLDTISLGLQGLAVVLKQGTGVSADSRDVARARAFIQAYGEHFPLTESMLTAQNIIDSRTTNAVVRIPFND